MTPRLSGQAIMAVLICLAGVVAFAGATDPVYFPAGYRAWTVAKFKFEAKGALRHHYANPQALASWGKFGDGSRDYVFSDPRR